MNNSVRNILAQYVLDSSNSIVIGSGILQVMNIRSSNDIDLVVDAHNYDRLKLNSRLQENNGSLKSDGIEIFPNWYMTETNMAYSFNELLENSVIIDGVRYITLKFLLEIKKLWVATDKIPREKDKNDIKLIEDYLRSHSAKSAN